MKLKELAYGKSFILNGTLLVKIPVTAKVVNRLPVDDVLVRPANSNVVAILSGNLDIKLNVLKGVK